MLKNLKLILGKYIKMSSLLIIPNEKMQVFSNSKYTNDAFKRFRAFFDEGKFTDTELSGCDHRK